MGKWVDLHNCTCAGKEKGRTILCGIDQKYCGEKSNNMQLGGSSRLHMCWEATQGPGHYGHLLDDGERSDLSQTDECSAVAVDTSWRECTQLGSSSAVHAVRIWDGVFCIWGPVFPVLDGGFNHFPG